MTRYRIYKEAYIYIYIYNPLLEVTKSNQLDMSAVGFE